MSGDRYIPHSIMLYGGSPDPMSPPPRVEPWIEPTFPSSGTGSLVPAKRRVSTAARIDADGKLHLRISVDGVHVREVVTDGTTVTIEEDI